MKLPVSYTSTGHLLRVVLNRLDENGRVETPVVATSSPQRLNQFVDLRDDRGLAGGLVERLNGVAVGTGAADGEAEIAGADFAGRALSVSSSRSLADHKGFRFVTQSQRAAACFCKDSRSSAWRQPCLMSCCRASVTRASQASLEA